MLPPNVNLTPGVVEINGTILLSSILSATDADGDPIAFYEIRDDGGSREEGSGYFEFQGGFPVNNEFFRVPANQLDQVIYHGATEFLTESISVKASDGVLTSGTRTTRITTGNSKPVVTGRNSRVRANEEVRIDQLFAVSDADNDRIRRYGFVDRSFSFAGESGNFIFDGQTQTEGRWFQLDAVDLSKVIYRGGSVGRRVETIAVQVYDGFSFSEISEFTITTSARPVVSVGVENEVLVNQRIAASELFRVTDADDDAIVRYTLVDRSTDLGGGYFELNGSRQASGTPFTVEASQLGSVFYVGAVSSPRSENIGVTAHDAFDSSITKELAIRTVSAPVVSSPPIVAPLPTSVFTNQVVDASSLFSVFDADGDVPERYWIVDRWANRSGGFFTLNGERLTLGRFTRVTAEEFPGLKYHGGAYGEQTENIGVQVYAGGRLSEVVDVAVTTLANEVAPTLNLINARGRLGTVFALSDLFTFTDPDSDAFLRFGVYDSGDGPDTGYFSLNGERQPDRTWLILDADQLDGVRYHVGTTASEETLQMFLNDGHNISEVASSTGQAIETPNFAASNDSISVDTLENVPLADFFAQQDAGPDYTLYEVFDENQVLTSSGEDRSARLRLDGRNLAGGVVHSLTPDEFSRLQLQGAEVDFGRNFDSILVRATNGMTGFSEWERINVNTDPVGVRALEVLVPSAADPDVLEPLQMPGRDSAVGATEDGRRIFTYSFIDGGSQTGNGTRQRPSVPPLPSYYFGHDNDNQWDEEAIGTLALNQPQREAIRQVLANYESYIDVQFVEQPYEIGAAESQFVFGAQNGPNNAYLPLTPEDFALGFDSVGGVFIEVDDEGNEIEILFGQSGDVWFSTGAFDPRTAVDTSLGGSFYATALELVGEALGLTTPTGSPSLSIFNNYTYNTILATQVDGVFNTLGRHPENPSTPALYDVAQLQNAYGANTTFNDGDDTYLYNVSHQQTLWDAGGNDTISLEGNTEDETIDLRQGTFSTITGVDLSLRIAYGTVIENARGGSGNDSLHGNETTNFLYGGDGNDVLIGGGDNDQLFGGAGDDLYQWTLGDGRDAIRELGAGGTDVLEFRDPSGNLDALEDDLYFRKLGNDLRIDLRFNQGAGVASVIVKEFGVAGSEVETLRLFDTTGTQIGGDIDLLSVYAASDASAKRFQVTAEAGTNGFLAVPV